MKTRSITLGFMAVAFLAIVSYDLWVYLEPTEGDTISEITLEAVMSSHTVAVIIGLAVGFLLGHLFWPQRIEQKGKK